MILLYMNQGGKGQWGAIPYGNYDILCLAESTSEAKLGFVEYYNDGLPPLSVQVKGSLGRAITGLRDIDLTAATVRPMVSFALSRVGVRIVFVHLKSASETQANKALAIAAQRVKADYGANIRVLWIGDFNRASDLSCLKDEFGSYIVLLEGGGQARWDLDRAIITGGWENNPTAEIVSSAGADHGHIAIRVDI